MRKKIAALTLCLLLVAAVTVGFTACDNDTPSQYKWGPDVQSPAGQKTIVYLGDSIAEALLGPSPISGREDYGYYSIVGQRNGYRFLNYSVSGHKTSQLLDFISGEDARTAIIANEISKADIIHVSILGNDLLQNMSMDEVIIGAAQSPQDFSIIDDIAETALVNIGQIVTRLRVLNPDAVLMFQKVYNPVSENSTLISKTARTQLLALGVEPSEFRALGEQILNRLNGVLDSYLAQEGNANAFHILDAQTAFEQIYAADAERGKGLIYPDYVHPSNEGHAVLADVTQKKLEELGLADAASALEYTKMMRKATLGKFYGAYDDELAEVAKQIDDCTSCEQITEVFFRFTAGKTPVYA